MEIHVEHLKKIYGNYLAVDIDALHIPSGESFGLVGNNGAGKTTFFRCILDLVECNEGRVLMGEEATNKTERWKHFTGSYLDEHFLIGHLVPEEYFDFIAHIHGIPNEEKIARLQQFESLFNNEILGGKKLIRDLSKGNQKKVGVAAALLFNPKVLVLDEPFANLDPSSQFRLKDLLRSLRENRGVTVLISSHDLNHVTEVCERIVLMEKGRIVRDIRTSTDTQRELESYFSGV